MIVSSKGRKPLPESHVPERGELLEASIRQGGGESRRVCRVGRVQRRGKELLVHGHHRTAAGDWSTFLRTLYRPWYRVEEEP